MFALWRLVCLPGQAATQMQKVFSTELVTKMRQEHCLGAKENPAWVQDWLNAFKRFY